MLKPGLYEQIINSQLRLELDTATNRIVDTALIWDDDRFLIC